MKIHLLTIIIILTNYSGLYADSVLSKNSPTDNIKSVVGVEELTETQMAIIPYIKEAKNTYFMAKKKFIKGLSKGENFFISTQIIDYFGNMEQVFILVKSINNIDITGIIYSKIRSIKGYKFGDIYTFKEENLVDWTITKPDGSEEGNFVGKFLDRSK